MKNFPILIAPSIVPIRGHPKALHLGLGIGIKVQTRKEKGIFCIHVEGVEVKVRRHSLCPSDVPKVVRATKVVVPKALLVALVQQVNECVV